MWGRVAGDFRLPGKDVTAAPTARSEDLVARAESGRQMKGPFL